MSDHIVYYLVRRAGVPFILLAVMGTVADLVLLIIFTTTLGSAVTVACVMVGPLSGCPLVSRGAALRRYPAWGAWHTGQSTTT